MPRFRQLLYVPPRPLGRPLWVDAPEFDLSHHIRVVPPPAPGDETQLLVAVEQLRRRGLDRTRPLWEMWFLPGLPQGRVGLFVRMHHAIADGMSAVATMATFLDLTPDSIAGPAKLWTPAPAPTSTDLLYDNLRQHIHRLGRGLSALVHPVTGVQHALAAWPAMRELLAE